MNAVESSGGTVPVSEAQTDADGTVASPNPEDDLSEVLEGAIEDPKKRAAVRRVLAMSVQVRSPYLPPEYLRAYEEIVPGSAAEVFQQVRVQSDHRRELESAVVHGGERRADRGQILGFIIAMAFFAGSVALGFAGKEILAGVLGTVDLVALVALFVLGRDSQQREASRPDPAPPVPARPHEGSPELEDN